VVRGVTATRRAPLALGECERCIDGEHGIIKDGRCVCCSLLIEGDDA
jgi:hypothetical protein